MENIIAEPNLSVNETGSLCYSAPATVIIDERKKIKNPFWRFTVYCKKQQKNCLAWLGLSLLLQGGVLVPITLMCVAYNGNIFGLWIPVIFGFALTEICNLSGMPTKTTIPVFYVNILINTGVIILSFIL